MTAIPDAAWLFGVTLLGVIVGSFLNVVIHRLPIMLDADDAAGDDGSETTTRYDLISPPSSCPHCSARIRPTDNIPLLSFLWLRGKCRACAAKISVRYPVVEALSGGLALLLYVHFGPTLGLAAALVLVWSLLVVALIDLEHMRIPDAVTLPLLWLGLLVNITGTFAPATQAILGAVAGYGALWLLYWLIRAVKKIEALGHGDFKLFAALGAWFGWQQLPTVLFVASLAGSVVGIGLLITRKRELGQPIPFAPFLCLAGLITLLYGSALEELYFDIVFGG